ncbi:hypothetical protein Pelo_3793 [Pelomyxa schiedti]|nr:hypothetical protein Pelo_3793 [Pelomyxa schiedti]
MEPQQQQQILMQQQQQQRYQQQYQQYQQYYMQQQQQQTPIVAQVSAEMASLRQEFSRLSTIVMRVAQENDMLRTEMASLRNDVHSLRAAFAASSTPPQPPPSLLLSSPMVANINTNTTTSVLAPLTANTAPPTNTTTCANANNAIANSTQPSTNVAANNTPSSANANNASNSAAVSYLAFFDPDNDACCHFVAEDSEPNPDIDFAKHDPASSEAASSEDSSSTTVEQFLLQQDILEEMAPFMSSIPLPEYVTNMEKEATVTYQHEDRVGVIECSGDFTLSDCNLLIQDCSCFSSGSGLSKDVKSRWPEVLEVDSKTPASPKKLGHFSAVSTSDQVVFVNLYAHYENSRSKRKLCYQAMRLGLSRFISQLRNQKPIPERLKIGATFLGCSSPSSWELVKGMLQKIFTDMPIYIFTQPPVHVKLEGGQSQSTAPLLPPPPGQPVLTTTTQTESARLHVGFVPTSWSEAQLAYVFSVYGPLHQVVLLRNKQREESGTRAAFVDFKSRSAANAAIVALHNKHIPGINVKLSVGFAKSPAPMFASSPAIPGPVLQTPSPNAPPLSMGMPVGVPMVGPPPPTVPLAPVLPGVAIPIMAPQPPNPYVLPVGLPMMGVNMGALQQQQVAAAAAVAAAAQQQQQLQGGADAVDYSSPIPKRLKL